MDYRAIMMRQPTINIGVIGHVANGKSRLVEALTGEKTQRYDAEKKGNMTIRLGYSNCKIYQCTNCPKPQCFVSTGSHIFSCNCKHCGTSMELVHHISFVDCPGHSMLLSTMLNGTCVMDYTILIESVEHSVIPSPQTVQHLDIVNLNGLKPYLVCMNKIDLCRDEIKVKIDELDRYLAGHGGRRPIIPISANFGANLDVVLEYLAELVPTRRVSETLKLITVRSFDVNPPGSVLSELKGGVIGGSIVHGSLTIGDKVEILPGYQGERLYCEVLSIYSGRNSLERAIPGGLIGVQLSIDPGLTRNDGLVGSIVKRVDERYDVIITQEIKLRPQFFTDDTVVTRINVNSNDIVVDVIRSTDTLLELRFDKPIALGSDDFVSLLNGDRVVGRGSIIG